MNGKDLSVYALYEVYGELLTDNQRFAVEDYYGLDLSLGEIAEVKGISRQAVKDALTAAEKQLAFFEEKLALARKLEKIRDIADGDGSKEIKAILNILEGK